jgi:hypothetical protein
MSRPQRLTGVLDERQAVASRDHLEAGHVCRIAEDVDREDRLRAARDRRLGRLRIEVERHWVDVREDRARPLVERGVGRGDEREGARDHLVPLPHPDRSQRQVQAGCATADGARLRGADLRCEAPLELCEPRPQRKLPGAQHLDHRALLLLAQHRPGEGNRLLDH